MTYDPTIPKPTDYLSVSQGNLLTNFGQANLLFGVNHVNFDASLPAGAGIGDAGKHYAVTVIDQAAAPATAANEVALHSLAGDLYFRKESNGTDIQMSIGALDPVAANTGTTFLPGGIILKWGRTALAADTQLVTFATAFPNACFGVTATNINSGNNVSYFGAYNIAAASFQLYHKGGTLPSNVFWIAVGN